MKYPNVILKILTFCLFALFAGGTEVSGIQLDFNSVDDITPNSFEGTDTERIHQAIVAAAKNDEVDPRLTI